MALIKFTRNHEDLCTEHGYQFKFFCDKCGSGTLSRFVTSTSGIAGSAIKAVGGIFGGIFGRAATSADEARRLAQGKGKDDAFAAAVEEVKGIFKQCSRCGKWVCPDVCWNAKKGLCEACAPDLSEELAAAQAQESVRQVQKKLQSENLIQDVDVTREAAVRCPKCDAQVKGSKFCPDCGEKMQPSDACPKCAAKIEPGKKFCGECGHKLGA